MKVAVPNQPLVELGVTETNPTVGIVDYSRRVTDDFGVTTVFRRGFARTMSVRMAVPFEQVDALQQRLADLRTTPATWIADDRFRALSVFGTYDSFDIDVASRPCSFSTLTINGFAETLDFPDAGGDPAVAGQASTFSLLQPRIVTDAVLRASSVPEGDHPAWSGGTTYAKGARVVVGRRVFESLIDGNTGNPPATSTQWLDAAPTNRFAMFDQALGTETTATGSIVVTLAAADATALALLDVTAATVRVQGAGYDQQRSIDGTMTFDGLPSGDITVTVAGPGTVAVGTLLFGRIVALGVTETSPTAGITDYSRKDVDDFGDVTIVPRAWAKRLSARALISTDALDLVFERIASVRATPSLWIADNGTEALTLYGTFKDFSIEVGETVSKLSVQVDGLSEAAKTKPLGDGAPGRDGVDGKDGTNGVDGKDGRDGVNGTDGAPGVAGLDGRSSYVHFAYADSPNGQVNFAVGVPGNRGWQGRYTDFTAADSQNPADYTWAAYKGPAAFGLTGSGDTNVSGNALIKQGSGGWDTGGGYSTEGWRGGAQCSFKPGQTSVSNIMAGLNGDPAANDSFNTIDYAWFFADDGLCRIYESGAGIATIGGYGTQNTFQIIYDGASVRYIKDGVTVRNVAAPKDALLYFDAAMAGGPGTRLDAITFAAAGTAGADGKDGVDGLPGVNGADGVTYYTYVAYANSADGAVDFTVGQPLGRAFIGHGSGTSPTEPDTPASYTWSEYRGPPFGMTGGGVSIAGTQIIKTDPSRDWNAQAYSTVGYRGGATMTARPGQTTADIMVGLNDDPTANASYETLSYAWYFRADSVLTIYEGGVEVQSAGLYSAGNAVQVDYDGRTVRYFVGGVLAREVAAPADMTLYFDSSLHTPGSRIVDVGFAKAGTAGKDGRNGVDGVPGVRGADGTTYYPYFAYANSPDGQIDFTTGAPERRAYVGFASGATPAEPTDPGAYSWTQYRGPAFGLTTAGCAAAGDTIVMTRSGGWGTAGAYSTTGFKGGAATSFRAKDSFDGSCNIMAGLNTDPATNDSYESIDYCWHLADNGNADVYISGGYQAVPGVTAFGLGTFQVTYDNRKVRWSYNGTIYHEVDAPAGLSLFFDAALAGNAGKSGLSDVTFAAAGAAGVDGAPTLSAYLTNENFSHPTDANGLPVEITSDDGTGQIRVFLGGQDVTAGCTFTAQLPFNLALIVDQYGSYRSTGLYGDSGYAFVIASYQGQAISKRVSATRAKRGVNGESPPQVEITASSQAILLNSDGSLAQNAQIVFSAIVRNTPETVFWTVNDGTGRPHRNYSGGSFLTDAADLLAIINYPSSQGEPNTRFCTVRASCGGASDIVTVIAVQNGAPGRNGTDGAPGQNGADGRTTYVHIAYADSPNGQVNFTADAPGGRAFQGTYTDFTAADSQNPADYVWTPYKGPPAFGLIGSGDTFVGGNALIKQGSGGWGTGGGYSTEGYRGGAQCSFVGGQGTGADIMAGLNSDPATNNGYETIDYAWYLESNGTAFIYESGGHGVPYVTGYGSGTFQVVYDNRKVRYLYNGTIYREIDVPADQLLYFDAAVAGPPGTRLNAIAFGAAGRAGNDGKDGIPGTNGSNGQPGRDGRDGNNGSNGADGRNGTDGRTSYVHYAYANSEDGYADFTTGAAGGRSFVGIYVDYNEPDSQAATSYRWTRLRGLDGNNGIPGAPGADGRTPYVHTAYANSADGYADFTTDDAQALNRRYIGLRTDYEPADSQAANAYVWSLSRGADGAPGAPGTSPFALDLGSYALVVSATYNGQTKPGQLPRNVAVSVKQGTADAIGAVAIGVTTSAGITASYSGGVVSITQIDADGYVEVTATQGGTNVVAPKRIAISRNLDPAPPSSATGQTITGYNGDPNSTSYLSGPSGRIATVEVPANGQMPISLYVEYSVAPDSSAAIRAYAAAAKIVYRPIGGSSWSDLQGEAVGSAATWRRSDEDFVQGEISYDVSVGMSAKQTYEFALMVRKHSGNGQAQYIQATMRVGV